jgi:hypothetical protein
LPTAVEAVVLLWLGIERPAYQIYIYMYMYNIYIYKLILHIYIYYGVCNYSLWYDMLYFVLYVVLLYQYDVCIYIYMFDFYWGHRRWNMFMYTSYMLFVSKLFRIHNLGEDREAAMGALDIRNLLHSCNFLVVRWMLVNVS